MNSWLANHTAACSMTVISYWHDIVVCLSVCPFVCLLCCARG